MQREHPNYEADRRFRGANGIYVEAQKLPMIWLDLSALPALACR